MARDNNRKNFKTKDDAQQLIEKMVKSRASRLIYISCNPATLARDLARLEAFDNGFVLDSLKAYDMYAGTTHLEVMAVLKR